MISHIRSPFVAVTGSYVSISIFIFIFKFLFIFYIIGVAYLQVEILMSYWPTTISIAQMRKNRIPIWNLWLSIWKKLISSLISCPLVTPNLWVFVKLKNILDDLISDCYQRINIIVEFCTLLEVTCSTKTWGK